MSCATPYPLGALHHFKPETTGCCPGVLGSEGTRFSRTRRRRSSGPSMVNAHDCCALTIEDRLKKALFVVEIYVPSVCMVYGTPAAPARRHAVHDDCKQGAAAPAPQTLATLPTCFRAPTAAADSMGSSSFISDHMHTMRSGQRSSADHRQACDGRLFGHIIQPTLDYVASVTRLSDLLRRTLT